jgi:hypothetical protein
MPHGHQAAIVPIGGAVRQVHFTYISWDDVKALWSAAIALVVLQVVVLPMGAGSGVATATSGDDSQLLQAYIYGYAPVAMAATRAVQTAVPDATSSPGKAPINQFSRSTTLATPSNRTVVRPNSDTLYTSAWLDLTDEPIVLHVPPTGDRYVVLPMLDAYSNEFASVGSRTTGSNGGDFLIVGPRWSGDPPDGITDLIHAPTNTVWIIGRTLVHGESDLNTAVGLTEQYQLVPLSAYADFLRTGHYDPPTGVPVEPPDPAFDGTPVTSGSGFSGPAFFDRLADVDAHDPPPPDQLETATALVQNGSARKDELAPDLVAQAVMTEVQRAAATATRKNGWASNQNLGDYGTDYVVRAAAARLGLGATLAEEAMYLNTTADPGGQPLQGSTTYALHFAPGQAPPANGFWSLTVYDQNGFLVENPIGRYSLGSETGPVFNPDGSLDVVLQHDQPPPGSVTNWLPTPDGQFTLSLRLFWPAAAALSGEWVPPPLERR